MLKHGWDIDNSLSKPKLNEVSHNNMWLQFLKYLNNYFLQKVVYPKEKNDIVGTKELCSTDILFAGASWIAISGTTWCTLHSILSK